MILLSLKISYTVDCSYYTFLYSRQQYNSYAIRSQSKLTTNLTGRVCNIQFECKAQQIASIACLHNFFRHTLLSCSEILTYQLLGSQLFAFEELQIASNSHDQSRVSKLRHNSRTKLRINFSHVLERDNTVYYLHC